MCLSYLDPETGWKFLYCTVLSRPERVYAAGVYMRSELSWVLTQHKMLVKLLEAELFFLILAHPVYKM